MMELSKSGESFVCEGEGGRAERVNLGVRCKAGRDHTVACTGRGNVADGPPNLVLGHKREA